MKKSADMGEERGDLLDRVPWRDRARSPVRKVSLSGTLSTSGLTGAVLAYQITGCQSEILALPFAAADVLSFGWSGFSHLLKVLIDYSLSVTSADPATGGSAIQGGVGNTVE